ncbi:hypothetical protein [Thalassovita autumnalis]|uniref:hypothetical protein n=1 Tax=Thalassovita autumnalis TaxID=2072972 RepID=UPI001F5FE8C0|nr:hypothetical protein [Thalassovita autumnalis]
MDNISVISATKAAGQLPTNSSAAAKISKISQMIRASSVCSRNRVHTPQIDHILKV